ncbi:glycosyltransferase family 39 protein [Methylotenera sp. L2L1]|uniref:glycosyltransferase family 39 protein n=1 Tax=Methylotenera sp. L2L1 TaxID=1502770 RepID=UPI0005614201|nr:glycosyltransferase family 39 protein [Methylotenera sp. L2L1]
MTSKLFQRLSLALFSLLAVFILVTFKQYGISNDEQVQHVYGQLLLNFYSTGFADHAAFTYKNLYLYGGLFDLVAAMLEKILPLWVWDIRHLLSALFGFAGIVAVYKVTNELAGRRAAFLAAFLLAITGAWAGAMFTHTKDVSFAACMVWALYYTLLISKHLPHVPLALSLKLGVAVGMALGLRIGGAFAVIYLLLMLLVAGWLNAKSLKLKLDFYWQSFLGLLPAGVVAFCLMAIFWPWSVMGADHILIAVKSFSHFAFDMNTIINGEFIRIGDVPRTYLFQYLGIRLPEIFLLGLVSFFVVLAIRFKHLVLAHKLPEITVAIALFTPLIFVILDRPALYNGVRHFTFVIPTLAIVAGIGLSKMFDMLAAHQKWRVCFATVCMLLSMNTIYTLCALHPYQYLYYNHFAGADFKQAQHDWEGDYWSSSLIDATKILARHVDAEAVSNSKVSEYSVAVCAEAFQGQAYLDERFKITENWVTADFFISSTNMNCDKVLQGEVIGIVERLGAPLAVVKDRRALIGEARRPRAAPRD